MTESSPETHLGLTSLAHHIGISRQRVTARMDDNPIYVFLNTPYISARPVADILTIMLTIQLDKLQLPKNGFSNLKTRNMQ